MIQIQGNNKKLHVGSNLGMLDPDLGRQFSFRNLALSVNKYDGTLSSCILSEETNNPILRKFSDGRSCIQRDGQRDKSDIRGRCSIHVKRPISTNKTLPEKHDVRIILTDTEFSFQFDIKDDK